MGVRGSKSRLPIVEIVSGRVDCSEGSRHGVVPARLFGEIVKAIA